MVSIAVSKMGMTELIFVVPGTVSVTAMFYSLSRCCQRSRMLQAICLCQDMNLMDYKVWGVMQQRLYESRMNSVDS